MAARKVKDLAISTGTYQQDGQTKNRYVNIGGVFKDDNGGTFLLLHRHINLAGVPFREGSESVIVSVFELRDPNAPQQTQRTAAPARPAAAVPEDDDIPF